MASTFRQRFLRLLADGEDGLKADFTDLAAQIRSLLLTAADRDGTIPVTKWRGLEAQIRALVIASFISQHSGGAYSVDANGVLTPISPFMRRLWAQITAGTGLGVEQQAAILRKSLLGQSSPLQALERAAINPFLAFDQLIPDAQDAYRQYVPPYEYRWQDGKTLADRLMNAASVTQQKVGALIRDLLASQTNASQIADTLTRYFTGSLPVRNKPYGTTAAFDASRLLATEGAFAYHRASVMSALLNPLITQAEVYVSPAHRGADSCDDIVRGNPYAVSEVPIPPYHPFCACGVRFIVRGKTQATLDRLANADVWNVRGALSPDFADLLLRSGGVRA